MNIGFLHSVESEFNNLLLGRLNGCLRWHTVLSWLADEKAPSKDFDVLLVNGDLGRNQMEGQPNLKLIQTTNTGMKASISLQRPSWVSGSHTHLRA